MGPLEQKIEGLQKQISDSVDQCSQMQQFWLRQQNELVKKTRSNDDQTQAVNSLKKQLLILEQKKMRTDGEQCGPAWERDDKYTVIYRPTGTGGEGKIPS